MPLDPTVKSEIMGKKKQVEKKSEKKKTKNKSSFLARSTLL